MFSRIQYISQGDNQSEQIRSINEALDAGCDWIQVRYKNKTDFHKNGFAEHIKTLCNRYNATLIINDYTDIAAEIDADGVHLGLSDGDIKAARELLGSDKIIGGTANTLEQIYQRIDENCDYIGLGPYRFTATKDNLSPVLGLDGYNEIIRALRKKGLGQTKIFAIGGIETTDIESLMETGIYGIAVSGVIAHAKNKKEIVEQLKENIYGHVENC